MNAAPTMALDQDRPGSSFRHLVAAEVRAQMAREQISNRKFAAKYGLKPAWVDRRLNGTTPMDADDMQFFAEALGVSLPELLANALRRAAESGDDSATRFITGRATERDTCRYLAPLPARDVTSDHVSGTDAGYLSVVAGNGSSDSATGDRAPLTVVRTDAVVGGNCANAA